MNLASNTAPVSLTSPSSVAAIHGMVRWIAWRWTSLIRWPELSSYQRRLRSSVHQAELDDQDGRQVRGSRLAPLLLPEPQQGLLVLAHDDPGVGAADEVAPIEIMCLSHLHIPLQLAAGRDCPRQRSAAHRNVLLFVFIDRNAYGILRYNEGHPVNT